MIMISRNLKNLRLVPISSILPNFMWKSLGHSHFSRQGELLCIKIILKKFQTKNINDTIMNPCLSIKPMKSSVCAFIYANRCELF